MIELTRNPRTAFTMNAKTRMTPKKAMKNLRDLRGFAIFVVVSVNVESRPA
jgi:hypothetical protein